MTNFKKLLVLHRFNRLPCRQAQLEAVMFNMDLTVVKTVSDNIRRWLGGDSAEVAVTLGSGLGGFGVDFSSAREIGYAELGLPACTVTGHAGVLRFVKLDNGVGVLILDGRVHLYEGHTVQTVVLAVRALVLTGVKTHVLTCASGGVNTENKPGQLVLISDHVNLTGVSPLIGANHDQLGPRFPDMTEVYERDLRKKAEAAATDLKMVLKHGIYAAVMGPSYETPAEVRMLRHLGVDLVGMSTVPEVLAIRHLGGRVLGISCVANHAAGVGLKPLSHSEVVANCAATAPQFRALLSRILYNLTS